MPAQLEIVIGARDDASGVLKRLGGSLDGLKTAAFVAAAGATAALGGITAAAVSAAAGFEQTISGIRAVAGASATEMKAIQGLALQLGKDTVFSAQEAARGIEELIKGGVAVEDVMGGAARATLNLATAGGVSLPEAAEIAANALAIFRLKGKDMASVTDQIAGAANASSLSVSDFRFSMAAAGAVARGSGQTFADLAQAIAVMGKQGVKGSDAGTSLKTMLLNLQPVTKKQITAMRELGIITREGTNQFINANGSFKSMRDIADVLQRSLRGLTEAERQMKLEIIFGSDAIRAGTVFASEGAKGFDDMAKAMGKVTAESVANVKLDNLRGSLEQLKGSLETAAISAGLALTPALRKLADMATAMVNSWLPWIEAIAPRVVAGFERIFGVVSDVIKIVGDLVRTGDLGLLADNLHEAFGVDITGFVSKLSALSALVEGPLRAVTSTVAGALAEIKGFWQVHQTEIISIAQDMWDTIVAIIQFRLDTAGKVIQAFLDGTREAWARHGEVITEHNAAIWSGVFEAITTVLPEATAFIRKELGVIINWTDRNWPLIERTIKRVLDLVMTVVRGALASIRTFWEQHGELILAVVNLIWDTIRIVIDLALKTILDLITIMLAIINGEWGLAWETFKGIFVRIVTELVAASGGLFNDLRAVVFAVIGEIENRFNGFRGAIQSVIDAIRGLLDWIGRIPSSITLPSVSIPSVPSFAAAAGSSSTEITNNYYQLAVTTRAPVVSVRDEYAILRAMAGA